MLKVILWRRIGREIRITAEGMSVKNAFNDLAARFFIKDNIKKMEVVQRDPAKSTNPIRAFDHGRDLQFTYLRGRFVLGKQLDNKSAAQLAKLIDKGLRKF